MLYVVVSSWTSLPPEVTQPSISTKMNMNSMFKICQLEEGASNSACAVECNRYIHLDKYPNIGFYRKSANMSSTVNILTVCIWVDVVVDNTMLKNLPCGNSVKF